MAGLLKFITCGSVDDGKSTLIGHMLYDAKLLYTDQEKSLELESKIGSREGGLDYSLLLDGLMAEREQGITIDVAYRYFTTERRSFIVADTPGHEEYTRNMAVGASFADLAVILVDAGKGILLQTKRHARICQLMGIRYFVFAVNKMDLIRYDRIRYDRIEKDIKKLAVDLALTSVTVIPVSATEGDNITKNPKPGASNMSEYNVSGHNMKGYNMPLGNIPGHNVQGHNMPWYQGTTLLEYLEEVEIGEPDAAGGDKEHLMPNRAERGFILPVQRVCRPNHTFRGFQGQIESGRVAVGDRLTILPSGEGAEVAEILVGDRQKKEAVSGQPVTVRLDREVDVSRGCVLEKDSGLRCSHMFTTTLLWMDDTELVAGRNFYIKVGTRLLPAQVMQIKYQIDINTGEHLAEERLRKNEIGQCDIMVAERIVFDKFCNHRTLGSFILIDRLTNMTSACGIIEHSLRRADNVVWQETDITRAVRAERMNQKPITIWFTGLSGSGKSTLANAVEKRLSLIGKYTMLLDGDNIRMGLNRNLGFTETDRVENIRRIAEVARLMNDAGLMVLTAFISPYQSDREGAADIIGQGEFFEVYVSTSLAECERRDIKGLYKKARQGEIPNFTGITSPYEPPVNPWLTIDTGKDSLDECVERIMLALDQIIGAN